MESVENPLDDDRWEQAEEKYWTQARRQTNTGRALFWVFVGIVISVVSILSGFVGSLH